MPDVWFHSNEEEELTYTEVSRRWAPELELQNILIENTLCLWVFAWEFHWLKSVWSNLFLNKCHLPFHNISYRILLQELRAEWGRVEATVMFPQNIQCFPLFPVLVFPIFHEFWVRLFWNRAQMKVPGTLRTSQKGTNKAWRVLWFGPDKYLSGVGGILGDYPAKYLVTEENLLFSFILPFIIFAAQSLI